MTFLSAAGERRQAARHNRRSPDGAVRDAERRERERREAEARRKERERRERERKAAEAARRERERKAAEAARRERERKAAAAAAAKAAEAARKAAEAKRKAAEAARISTPVRTTQPGRPLQRTYPRTILGPEGAAQRLFTQELSEAVAEEAHRRGRGPAVDRLAPFRGPTHATLDPLGNLTPEQRKDKHDVMLRERRAKLQRWHTNKERAKQGLPPVPEGAAVISSGGGLFWSEEKVREHARGVVDGWEARDRMHNQPPPKPDRRAYHNDPRGYEQAMRQWTLRTSVRGLRSRPPPDPLAPFRGPTHPTDPLGRLTPEQRKDKHDVAQREALTKRRREIINADRVARKLKPLPPGGAAIVPQHLRNHPEFVKDYGTDAGKAKAITRRYLKHRAVVAQPYRGLPRWTPGFTPKFNYERKWLYDPKLTIAHWNKNVIKTPRKAPPAAPRPAKRQSIFSISPRRRNPAHPKPKPRGTHPAALKAAKRQAATTKKKIAASRKKAAASLAASKKKAAAARRAFSASRSKTAARAAKSRKRLAKRKAPKRKSPAKAQKFLSWGGGAPSKGGRRHTSFI